MAARALVLEEMAARRRWVYGREDTIAATLGDSLRRATARLANLSQRTPTADPGEYRRRLDAAAADKQRFERLLGERSQPFRTSQERRALGFAEVRAALPPRAALVAFVDYHRQTPATARAGAASGWPLPSAAIAEYLAFVLVPGDSVPRVVPLGEANSIDRLVGAWRRHASRDATHPLEGRYAERAGAVAGDSLRRRVWAPVAHGLEGLDHVFVVPAGSLNLVNFGALPAGSGRFVIESLPVIHYLSSERDLVPWRERRATGTGLLAMGGADFDHVGAGDARVAGIEEAPPRAARDAPYRGTPSHCGEFASLTFSPLPETTREVHEVCDVWRRRRASERPDREPRAGDARVAADATEAAFKHLAPGRRAIHLATHAFFLNPQCRPSIDGSASDAPGSGPGPAAITRENPLLLSGLALAGANRREQVHGDGEDGILTAEEVAALDLARAEWIMLSACETGLGVVEGGEGIFGLRRAFAVAGAGTVVISLWRVEDEATRRWTRLLYEARFRRGLGTAEAMRAACLQYLADCRAHGASPHPASWGAFIAAENRRFAPAVDAPAPRTPPVAVDRR